MAEAEELDPANPVDLVDAADRAYKALGHRDRRAVLRAIGGDEVAVAVIGAEVELAQPIVSQHLRVLRDAGLVRARVDGNRRLYSVDLARIDTLRGFLDHFWSTKLGDLKAAAEAEAGTDGTAN